MGYVVAKYIRLSIEDAKTDSLSIPNQRLILDQFIAGMGREDVTVLEFVDNGYSGTNFLRPGVTGLLEQVEDGEIDCIAVKDFSRFGRNMIDAGYYIEKLFPLYRVRFIALGDGYDSEDGGDDRSLAFPLLVNELYSKDLSRKISGAWENRARRGKSVTKNCLFGYRLDENKDMVIDPDAAETVRRIFSLALEGNSFAAIARILCAEGRPTPSAHKGRCKNRELACVWGGSVIRSILRNEQYTGLFLAGKTKTLQVGGQRQLHNPRERWIEIPDHHPAIVSREEFDAVREVLRAKERKGGGRNNPSVGSAPEIPLKGKVVCDCCGHTMTWQAGKQSKFRRRFTLSAPDADCHRLVIDETNLEKQMLVAVQARGAKAADDAFQRSARTSTEEQEPVGVRELYEMYRAGIIDLETFRQRKESLQSPSRQFTGQRRTQPRAMTHPTAMQTLTRELVEYWIDGVRVLPDGEICIRWRK